MKTWRVMVNRLFPDDVIEVRGNLEVIDGALVFSAAPLEYSVDLGYFRVIRDYAECWAVNADGIPLEPA